VASGKVNQMLLLICSFIMVGARNPFVSHDASVVVSDFHRVLRQR
jgi:hypothetical protein